MPKRNREQGRSVQKDLYTLTELSQLLGIDERVLRRWCEKGEIECVRGGLHFFVREQDLGKVIRKVEIRRERIKAVKALIAIAVMIVSLLLLPFSLFGFGYAMVEDKSRLPWVVLFFIAAFVFFGALDAINILYGSKDGGEEKDERERMRRRRRFEDEPYYVGDLS